MASIYKRPGTAKWQAQFYVKDPATGDLVKVRKSTRQTNRKKALALAIELERNAQGVIQAGTDRAQRAKSVFAEALASIDMETFTAPAARKYLAKLLNIATGEELASFTIQSWSEEWLRRKERGSVKSTMSRYKSHIEAFLKWIGDGRRSKPLESVTAQDARLWCESLQDQGLAGKTVVSYLKDMGSVYRAAIREGLITFNPFTALETIDTSDSMERQPFSLLEVARLLKHAPTEEWRGLTLVAAFTGLRLSDAVGLDWQTVNIESGTIKLTPSKTRKKKRVVFIPIQNDLLAYLRKSAKGKAKSAGPVFPKLAKIAVGAREGLSQTFNQILADAEVSRGKPSREVAEGQSIGRGRIIYERGFHSLRHTFTTWLRTAGVSEEDRMALTGHSTRESHQIYSHTDEDVLRAAIAKLPTLDPPKTP
jgi:integrase